MSKAMSGLPVLAGLKQAYQRHIVFRYVVHGLQWRMYRPTHLAALLRDALGHRKPVLDDAVHVREAMSWLAHAQDVTECGGLSAGYRLAWGWMPPFPEVTGYTIPTFFDYARSGLASRTEEYRRRALDMADWLIAIQQPDGGYQGGLYPGRSESLLLLRFSQVGAQPVAYDVGQIVLGLTRTFRETGDERYLQAALRAGQWLVSTQEPDGSWARWTYNSLRAAYYTCVAWSLIELGQVANERRFVAAAQRNLEWALSQQEDNGWFNRNTFTAIEHPLTHTIDYAQRGLWEAGILLGDERYLSAALKTSTALLRCYAVRGFRRGRPQDVGVLSARFDKRWEEQARYECLTGNAQIALTWLRMFQHTKDARYLNGALGLLDNVKQAQDTRCGHQDIRGAIPGSRPIWGDYMLFSFVSWAAKFFVDALLWKRRCLEEVRRETEILSQPPPERDSRA